MGMQITQREAIKYIREEDFMSNRLSKEEKLEIKNLHRKTKEFLKKPELVKEKVEEFEGRLNSLCADYYTDVLKFLKDEEMKNKGYNMISGYEKWSLSATLWQFMDKIYEVKDGHIEY